MADDTKKSENAPPQLVGSNQIIAMSFTAIASVAGTLVQKFINLSDVLVIGAYFLAGGAIGLAIYLRTRDIKAIGIVAIGAVLGAVITLMADSQARTEPVFVVNVTAFVDLNENGIRDGTEPLVPNLAVHVRDLHGTRMTRNTSETGIAQFPLARFGEIQVVTCTVSQSHTPTENPYEVDIGIEDADLTRCGS